MARIPHVYIPGPWTDEVLHLEDAARHHVQRVLRLADGAAVTYTDGVGSVGRGVLRDGTVLRGPEGAVERPTPHVTLAVSPPRSTDRARMVVEKLAELGVDRLVWLDTTRGMAKAPKPERSEAWATAALEQSHGAWSLQITGPVAVTTPWDDHAQVVVCDPGGEPAASWLGGRQPIVGLVGPEGGFAGDEIPDALPRVSLGDRILRVETAAIVLAALIRSFPENPKPNARQQPGHSPEIP